MPPIKRIFAFVVLLAACTTTGADTSPLRAERWIHPDADAFAQLATEPAECLARSQDPRIAHEVEVGRVLFRTPEILGGLAARTGLSCNACHVNGHDNPDFFLDGLSGAPGTVDATSAIFSKTRDDGRFNAVPIPTLVGARDRATFGSVREAELETFIHGVVEEEFQGAALDPALFDALLAYVVALAPEACPPQSRQPRTLRRHLREIERRREVISAALERGNVSAARMLVLGLQDGLEELHERLPPDLLARERENLRALGRSFSAWRDLPNGEAAARRFAALALRLSRQLEALGGRGDETLFSPPRLKAHLAGAPRPGNH